MNMKDSHETTPMRGANASRPSAADGPPWSRDEFEAQLRAKDGELKHVLISSNVRWENSQFKYTRCFTRDITERKRAEEEQALLLNREQIARALAEETEMRYHNLVHGVDAIVWEADAATFQFNFVSQRAEEILGYAVDQWLHEPNFWVNLIHPEDRERAVRLCREATAAGQDHGFEYRAVAADGRIVWLYDKVYLVRDAAGKVRQLRGLMVDITQHQRAEEEREQLLQREQAARVRATAARKTSSGG